jgi:hypothetical protein
VEGSVSKRHRRRLSLLGRLRVAVGRVDHTILANSDRSD